MTPILEENDLKKPRLKDVPKDDVSQSQLFLDSIIENIPDMVFVKDAKDLRFVRFNKAGEELLGFSREDLIGKNDHDFFPTEEAEAFIQKDREVLAQGTLHDIPEEPIHTRLKGTRYLHTKKIPILNKEGTPLYLLGISEDITEKKQVQEKLRLYYDVVENTQISIFVWQLEDFDDLGSFRLLAMNPMAKVVIGKDSGKHIGKTMRESRPDYLETKYPALYRDVIKTGEKMDLGEYHVTDENLNSHDYSIRAFPLPKNCVGVIRESITERKRLERQMLTVIGQEQKRIGQDLHDRLGQDLTAIAFMTKALEKTLEDKGSKEVDQVVDINKLVIGSIEKTRALARGLQPVELATGGLQPALEDLAITTENVYRIKCVFSPADDLSSQDYDVSLQLYRIAQEAIHNTVKHAKASMIEISLANIKNQLVLSIQDDGIGYSEDLTRGKKGMGLHLMHHRASAIDATLEIKKVPEGAEQQGQGSYT